MNPLVVVPCSNNHPKRYWQFGYKHILAIGFISLLSGCQSTPPIAHNLSNSLPAASILIDKSANLYQVDALLFRSEQLTIADIPLLAENHIDAIINLRFFDRDDDYELLAHIADRTPLTLYNQPLKSWKVTPREVAQILTQIKQLQRRNEKVLIHCYHGADRTGLVIAMYRIIEQGWSIEEAKSEMISGGFGYHSIWKNLENMLNPATIDAVRANL